ncbi:MAG: septal ring lytic transglycosylase RlpA family protein [Microcystis aeruginosa Ma_QC_B_20070730_S2]|uniref:Probable endolytic peptidoglycan transglycosylase RlpA n=1 Tax=Microcystis aeruginosa Ma_QC_B_20070730_S2 TaxID=2486256 RepID=A0A552DFH1_MICAE|nr:MAG: septal ring lytic transglycosylase RlpA family protein [Microcystis aeruginosa Ma_QC_B_20070730_S2]
MSKQLINKLQAVTALTVLGTTASIICSQTAGHSNSLTDISVGRQTVIDSTTQTVLSAFSNSRTFDSDIKVSRSVQDNANEILKTLESLVDKENTVPASVTPRTQEAIPSTVQPQSQPNQVKPAPASNPASVTPAEKPKTTQGTKTSSRPRKRGMASWYGPGFHGRRTASGETFNSGGLTAAHRYLPFGTRVRVTNLRNGRSVVVRINDRGPFSGGRVIDLSRGAAAIIGVFQSGVAPVVLEVLGR